MPSELPRTISYGQEKLLTELLDQVDEFDADWFYDLKSGESDIKDLSAQAASDFINALKNGVGDPQSPADPNGDESNDARTISAKQITLLTRLVKKQDDYDAEWFRELKSHPEQIKTLMMTEASGYISALIEKPTDDDGSATLRQSVKPDSSAAPDPLTPDQAQLIIKMLVERQLILNGHIVVDTFMRLLNKKAASSFIDTLKEIPRPKKDEDEED